MTISTLRRCYASLALLAAIAMISGCATTQPAGLAGYKPPRVPLGEKTALDNYVAAPDSNYSYSIVNTVKGEGYTGYIVEMTSQQYLTEKEVDKPIWKHYLTIVKPDTVKHSTGLLYVGGGSNDNPAPDNVNRGMAAIAVATQSVCTELRNIPNQPLIFTDDPGNKRSEDEIIAYTWDKFMRTGEEKWPLRLPMTKGAVRAMDTITAVCASPEGGNTKVDTFMVAGGSKRGWTTWTTAAVDKRVVAITPFVIDLLNVVPSFHHHWQVYGFWAPAVGDYQAENIMEWNDTPEYKALLRIEEPFSYRDRYTMPKYIVNACGDQFFIPDSSQFYFDQLPGEKYLRYVPNTDHSLRDSDAQPSMMAFYNSLLTKSPRPQYSWKMKRNGDIRVTCDVTPSSVKLWQATNPGARDFRVETFGKNWTSTDLEVNSKNVYTGSVPEPEKGYTAFMVELTFPSTTSAPFKFTTPVRVIPDVYPFTYTSPANPPKGYIRSKQASN
ncbi:MAG: PhoPQ-activated pathogenicity-related family protein [Candidatus Hydrogenedentes bacterium]|nr:PhoPQ-activated pathogenicity-related family protein [Candidatus Hydrogenedentota bacterium]